MPFEPMMFRDYRKGLERIKTGIGETILKGMLPDYAAYKAECAKISALDMALNVLDEILEKDSK